VRERYGKKEDKKRRKKVDIKSGAVHNTHFHSVRMQIFSSLPLLDRPGWPVWREEGRRGRREKVRYGGVSEECARGGKE
jgi:hypothetical protein